MSLEQLELGGNEANLRARLSRITRGVVRVFRQSVATEGFELRGGTGATGSLKLKNDDLQRVHGIVHEIDSRGVFYNCEKDEVPQAVLDSVQEARQALRESTKGVWADRDQEKIVQKIQQVLTTFSNAANGLDPLPRDFNHPNFKRFLQLLSDMRLEVWALIAALKNIHGDMINPMNMPIEILEEFTAANGSS